METELKLLMQENGIQFTDSRFESHLNLDNCGIRVDSFKIVWPGNRIDGLTVARQVYTKKTKHKGWGKGEVSYFLTKEKSPEFKTILEFIHFYKNK